MQPETNWSSTTTWLGGSWNQSNTAFTAGGAVSEYVDYYANGKSTITVNNLTSGSWIDQTTTVGWNGATLNVGTDYYGYYTDANYLYGGNIFRNGKRSLRAAGPRSIHERRADDRQFRLCRLHHSALANLVTEMAAFTASNPVFNPQTTANTSLTNSSFYGSLAAADKSA